MNKALIALFMIVTLLPGCAGVRLVDNQVSSFAPKPVATGASYRFERLPSQQADAPAQQRLEAFAEQALAKVGLKRADDNADLIAQVLVTERQAQAVMTGPFFGAGVGFRLGHHGGIGHRRGTLFPGMGGQPNYWREVHLTLREQASMVVVFETRASHDGPWSDTDAILPAMLDAALQGFPEPPLGVRQVNIEIPR